MADLAVHRVPGTLRPVSGNWGGNTLGRRPVPTVSLPPGTVTDSFEQLSALADKALDMLTTLNMELTLERVRREQAEKYLEQILERVTGLEGMYAAVTAQLAAMRVIPEPSQNSVESSSVSVSRKKSRAPAAPRMVRCVGVPALLEANNVVMPAYACGKEFQTLSGRQKRCAECAGMVTERRLSALTFARRMVQSEKDHAVCGV